jgi:hypothetical protein
MGGVPSKQTSPIGAPISRCFRSGWTGIQGGADGTAAGVLAAAAPAGSGDPGAAAAPGMTASAEITHPTTTAVVS